MSANAALHDLRMDVGTLSIGDDLAGIDAKDDVLRHRQLIVYSQEELRFIDGRR